MFTFLPKPYRSEVLKEHRMRVYFVGIILIIVLFIFGVIFTIPTFLATRSQEINMSQDKERVQKDLSSDNSAEVVAEVKLIKAKLAILSAEAPRKPLVNVLEQVLAQPRRGLSIIGISMDRGGDKGSIVIQGEADTRADLVSFSKSLQGEPAFSKVDLPVSSLAKGTNIAFTIRIESNF